MHGENDQEGGFKTLHAHRDGTRTAGTIANILFTADVDIRVRVRGGGHTSQVYAIRQAIAKSIVRLPDPTSFEQTAISEPERLLTSTADRILPEVHRRALQEPAEAGTRRLRPYPPRCRQQTVRAKEVRRSRCARQIPEVLPINGARKSNWDWSGYWFSAWLWAHTETLLHVRCNAQRQGQCVGLWLLS